MASLCFLLMVLCAQLDFSLKYVSGLFYIIKIHNKSRECYIITGRLTEAPR